MGSSLTRTACSPYESSPLAPRRWGDRLCRGFFGFQFAFFASLADGCSIFCIECDGCTHTRLTRIETCPNSTSNTCKRWTPRITCIRRSEEHTSELQSLMRISYAVFCLKKKKQHKRKQ